MSRLCVQCRSMVGLHILCGLILIYTAAKMSSTEVARIERPPEKYWRYGVANSYMKLLKISSTLAVIGGSLTMYFLVIRKKQMFDEYEKKNFSEVEMQKKFDNMVKLKCFRCKQLDKYEWD